MRHVNVTIDFAGDEKAADIAAVAAFVAATPDGGVSVTTAGDGSAVFTVPVTDAGVGMVGGALLFLNRAFTGVAHSVVAVEVVDAS